MSSKANWSTYDYRTEPATETSLVTVRDARKFKNSTSTKQQPSLLKYIPGIMLTVISAVFMAFTIFHIPFYAGQAIKHIILYPDIASSEDAEEVFYVLTLLVSGTAAAMGGAFGGITGVATWIPGVDPDLEPLSVRRVVEVLLCVAAVFAGLVLGALGVRLVWECLGLVSGMVFWH